MVGAKAVVRIRIEIDRNRFFYGGPQFPLKMFNECSYPPIEVVVVAVRDENVVLKAWDYRCHNLNIPDFGSCPVDCHDLFPADLAD